jgi:hypothetical protein
MILTEFIKIKWHGFNKRYYSDKGYIFTKIGDILDVKISDLQLGSNEKILVKCDVCNNERYISYKNYLNSYNNCKYYSCSKKCGRQKFKETNLRKYGVENPSQLQEIKDKKRQSSLDKFGVTCTLHNELIKEIVIKTNIEKYGVKYPQQSDIIKNKTKETCLKKYNTNSVLQSEIVKDKIKETNLRKYGVENPSQSQEIKNKKRQSSLDKFGTNCTFQSEIVKDKIKETNLRKYDVEYSQQNKKIREKINKTNLKKYGNVCSLSNDEIKKKVNETVLRKYGTDYTFQSEIIKDKIKETNLKKYGVEYPLQNKNVMNSVKKTNLEKYGVEYASQNKEIINKIQQTMVEKYGEIYFKYTPKYNINSIIYLDIISEKLGLPIQHGLNDGEKKFIKYWVDGYIEKYNICIEWDEKHHNSIRQKEKDIIREQYLIENFDCKIIRINEKEFLKDVDNQINIIIEKINDFINNKK